MNRHPALDPWEASRPWDPEKGEGCSGREQEAVLHDSDTDYMIKLPRYSPCDECHGGSSVLVARRKGSCCLQREARGRKPAKNWLTGFLSNGDGEWGRGCNRSSSAHLFSDRIATLAAPRSLDDTGNAVLAGCGRPEVWDAAISNGRVDRFKSRMSCQDRQGPLMGASSRRHAPK